MEFVVAQLRIAGEWVPPIAPGGKKYDFEISIRIKSDIMDFLAANGECTASQVATGLRRSARTAKGYLRELAQAEKVTMTIKKHCKPAIYKAR